jgi:demethylmenaquinone methyltransferase/2-methoxy-6-polyprenyl-1,4-benzoquinol methylase
MFSQIAGRYDLANNVLSGGVHHLWRTKLVDWSGAKPGDKILDCATGTGDLAIQFKSVVGPTGDVTGTDFCAEMMGPAPGKAEDRGLQIKFEQADVMNLPYEDATFDISSISFGIRNVSDPQKGISELARVVKPGGHVMILEFGQPENSGFAKASGFAQAYKLYSEKVLPTLGGWITGKKSAYEYLQNSSAQFPCREEFVALMRATGRFSSIEYVPVTFGVAYLYKGVVKTETSTDLT